MSDRNCVSRHAVWAFGVAVILGGGRASADPVELHGYVQPQMRALLQDEDGKPRYIDSSEPLFRAEFLAPIDDKLSAFAAFDGRIAFTRPLTQTTELELKEVYGDLFVDKFSLRAGKQIFGWGVIEDLSPVDFLNPQELADFAQNGSDRKIGTWSIAATFDFGLPVIRLVVIPLFTPSKIDMGSVFTAAADRPPLLLSGLEKWQKEAQALEAGYRAQIQKGLTDLSAGIDAVTSAVAQIGTGIDQIEAGVTQIDAGLDQIDTQRTQLQALPPNQVIDTNGTTAAQALQQIDAQEQALVRQKTDLVYQRSQLVEQQGELQNQHQDLLGQQQQLLLQQTELTGQSAAKRAEAERSLGNPRVVEPVPLLETTQAALRVTLPFNWGDVSLTVADMIQTVPSLFYAQPPTPTELPTLELRYPRVRAGGIDFAIPYKIVTVKGEGAFFLTKDWKGEDPWVSNPYVQYIGQVSIEPVSDLEIRAGWMEQRVLKVDNAPERDQENTLPRMSGNPMFGLMDRATMTVVRYGFGDAMHRLQAVWLFDVRNKSHFVAPEADFGLYTGLRVVAGAQILGGKTSQPGFGRIRDQDQAYLKFKYSF